MNESLRPYAIADKLRTLRLRKSMGLAQLAEHTGLSQAMLSRLENGRLVPTLPTLTRIATVFSVGLDYFFTDPPVISNLPSSRPAELLHSDHQSHPAFIQDTVWPHPDR